MKARTNTQTHQNPKNGSIKPNGDQLALELPLNRAPDLPALTDSESMISDYTATGISIEHRTTTTPTLKSGKPGKTKVAHGEVEDAAK